MSSSVDDAAMDAPRVASPAPTPPTSDRSDPMARSAVRSRTNRDMPGRRCRCDDDDWLERSILVRVPDNGYADHLNVTE